MNKKFHFFLWVALFIIGSFEQARAMDTRWYLTPGLLYISPDSARQAEQDIGLQLGIGRSVSDSVNVEWNFVRDTLPQEAGALRFKQSGWSIDGIRFKHRETFSTYALLGVGILKTEFNREEGNALMGQVGLGVMRLFWGSDRIKIRGDIRYRIDERNALKKDRFGDTLVHLGLTLPFDFDLSTAETTPTTSEKPITPFIAPPVMKDTDQDGVSDGSDLCPATPKGTPVNDIGC